MSKKYGIHFQEKQDTVVKGADVSPMDFFGFGWLKYRVQQRKARTLNGFRKVIREEWASLSVTVCVNVYSAWKKRCLEVAQRHGSHIEQLKSIHDHVKNI